MRLPGAGREKGDEVQERIARPDHPVEPGIGELREFGFERGRDRLRAGDAAAQVIAAGGTRLVDIGDVEDRFGGEQLQRPDLVARLARRFFRGAGPRCGS
jgi:hypothetical protein